MYLCSSLFRFCDKNKSNEKGRIPSEEADLNFRDAKKFYRTPIIIYNRIMSFFIIEFVLYWISAKLRQFSQNHLWMPLKVGFEHIVCNHITCKTRRCWTIFSEYIVGGQGFLQKNMYQMQICPSICWYNHLFFSCIFLYSCV